MADLILSKRFSTSRLIRSSGLFHGIVVFMPRMTQCSGTTLVGGFVTLSIAHDDVISVSGRNSF